MKITIAAVGKLKAQSSYYRLIAEFEERIPWQMEWKEVEEKKPLPTQQLKEQEAQLLLQTIPAGSAIIALDEAGKQMDSVQFAEALKRIRDEGRGIAFLIGGAAGHGEKVKQKADMLLSLGKMTWPHMLVRVLLTEQLYRAHTILSGHPYHKA